MTLVVPEQGNWTDEGGCPAAGLAGARIVPLERNGQKVNLQQRKFHISIPFLYSTAGCAVALAERAIYA